MYMYMYKYTCMHSMSKKINFYPSLYLHPTLAYPIYPTFYIYM